MTLMSAADWDDRYRGTDLVWSATLTGGWQRKPPV
jgi:hypothetical protein